MHPTKVVYESWKKTPSLPYSTSKEDRVIELLDPKEHKNYITFDECDCYLCGEKATSGMDKKKLLPKTFNDHDKARSPESQYVCEACSFMILTNPNRRQAIRWFHYVAPLHGDMKICNVGDLRERIINPPKPPFVMCATTTQKKHLMWYLQTSYDREVFYVTLETETIRVDHQQFLKMMKLVEELYNRGVSKADILNNTIPYGVLSVEEWAKAYEEINEYKRHDQFKLAVFVAQKEDGK